MGFGYVDDCDLIEIASSPAKVFAHVQTTVSLWEDVVADTSGVMDPSKSWWYLVDFKWKDRRWEYDSSANVENLIAHDNKDAPIPLHRLKASESREMLGVFLSPDGDQSTQMATLASKVTNWCSQLRHSTLSCPDMWQAMTTRIFKTIEYPLPDLTVSCAEFQKLIWPIVSFVLPKCGICRNISSPVCHGPNWYDGIEVLDPYFKGGSMRVRELVEHSWKQTPTGPLLTCNLESLLVES